MLWQPLPRDHRKTGNVVDRLVGIEFSALAAGAIENIDDRAFDIEQAKLEHREQATRPRPDDDGIGFGDLAGVLCAYGRIVHGLGFCCWPETAPRDLSGPRVRSKQDCCADRPLASK